MFQTVNESGEILSKAKIVMRTAYSKGQTAQNCAV